MGTGREKEVRAVGWGNTGRLVSHRAGRDFWHTPHPQGSKASPAPLRD